MKLILIFIIIVLVGCTTTTQIPHQNPTIITKTHTTIKWLPFNDDLIKKSIILNKLIFVYLNDESCDICKRMEKSTFGDKFIIKLINNKFISTSIDVEQNPIAAAIFYNNDITVPKIVFIKPTDDRWIVSEITGYMNVFRMVEAINAAEIFVKDNINENQSN